MLFTNIQLDDFSPTLARFLERIEIEGAEEREWIMMAVVNISAILEYGRPSGMLRKVGLVGTREGGHGGATVRVVSKKTHVMPAHLEDDGDEKRMDVDDETFKGDPQVSPALSDADIPTELPVPLKFAMELAFSMLSLVLRNPTRKASPFARSTLNPYLSVMLTFLATVTKHADALSVLERSIPWHDLTQFFATIPRDIFSAQGLNIPASGSERWAMLTSGCAPPLPEDWCLRGMEWVGRKVFERGYWKSGEERRVEVDVLDVEEGGQLTDGIIEDEDDEDEGHSRGESSHGETSKRWTRIVRSAICLSNAVDGFIWVEGTREWRVEGTLEAKVRRWHEEDRLEREAEERRRHGRRWTDDSMDIDGADDDADVLSEESEDDEGDSDQVKALKVSCLVFACLGRYLILFIGAPEVLAVSSCFRTACACARSGIQTAVALSPFPEKCVDAIFEHRAWLHYTGVGYQRYSIFSIRYCIHYREPSMDRCPAGACHNGT